MKAAPNEGTQNYAGQRHKPVNSGIVEIYFILLVQN